MRRLKVAVLIIACIALLSSCGLESEIIHTDDISVIPGSYYLFKTGDAYEYLEFLENLDDDVYEIVDISTSIDVSGYGSDEFYMITYKVKEVDSNTTDVVED